MNSNNIPSIEPANNNSLAGTLQFSFLKLMQGVNGMLPATVIAFDRTQNRVQVQLLITILTTSGEQVARQQIASLPVLLLGGGGYVLNFNLNAGDLGWVLASDRDISLFLQSYSQSPPNTARMFSFSDGLFIPDVMRGYTIDPTDAENAVLQNLDGTIAISLTPTGVKIRGGLTVEGLLTAQGGLAISGGVGGSVNITGDVNMTGELAVDGNITATGDITPHV